VDKIPPKTSNVQPNFTEPEVPLPKTEPSVPFEENTANVELEGDSVVEAAPDISKYLPTGGIRHFKLEILQFGRIVPSLFHRGVDSVSGISPIKNFRAATKAVSGLIPNLASHNAFSALDPKNPFSAGQVKREELETTQDGKTRYSKRLEFSGLDAIERMGSHSSKTLKLNVDGEELQFTQQMVIDFSRGQAGTQDLFIGQHGVERENTGGHVTMVQNWREDPQWLKDSLKKIYELTERDVEKTRLVTTFMNQRVLNHIIFNLQNDVNEKLKVLVTQGNYRMSWRLSKEASEDGQSEEIVVRAELYGKVPHILRDNDVLPADGKFSGVAVINLTTDIADIFYSTELDLRDSADDSVE